VGLAFLGLLILAFLFKPPTRGPVEVEHALEKAPGQPEGGVPSPV
jgi:hypothetical protein